MNCEKAVDTLETNSSIKKVLMYEYKHMNMNFISVVLANNKKVKKYI